MIARAQRYRIGARAARTAVAVAQETLGWLLWDDRLVYHKMKTMMTLGAQNGSDVAALQIAKSQST
jgi:hypothetical protein